MIPSEKNMKTSEDQTVLQSPENLSGLSKRLDECFKVIKDGNEGASQDTSKNAAEDVLLKHGYIYASFLSDLMAGRISGSKHDLTDLLRLIQEFCEMIELDSKLISDEAKL